MMIRPPPFRLGPQDPHPSPGVASHGAGEARWWWWWWRCQVTLLSRRSRQNSTPLTLLLHVYCTRFRLVHVTTMRVKAAVSPNLVPDAVITWQSRSLQWSDDVGAVASGVCRWITACPKVRAPSGRSETAQFAMVLSDLLSASWYARRPLQ